MVIRWLGHSSFLIIAGDGTKIITDPYEPGSYGGAVGHGSVTIEPDVVTVSHDHADHAYVEGLPNHFSLVSQPGLKNVKGIEFRGVETYHDAQHGAQRGRNMVFAMNADHIRLCHLGDLGHVLSGEDVCQIGEVDVLLIPVGGTYTLGPEEADCVIGLLNPKLVIPMHYKTEKIGFSILPVDAFLQGKENVRHVDDSDIEISRETLPDQRQIVVLKAAL